MFDHVAYIIKMVRSFLNNQHPTKLERFVVGTGWVKATASLSTFTIRGLSVPLCGPLYVGYKVYTYLALLAKKMVKEQLPAGLSKRLLGLKAGGHRVVRSRRTPRRPV